MLGLGTGELVLVGICVVVFVGPKRIPVLGSSLALGIKNFKKVMNNVFDDPKLEDDSKH
ncbi:MAG: twin-arginine translocase TatA/TatE family subunit [Bacteriovoracaceae bacterium]|nr:twin-arginine translocase TatA/TatE family subunit [Bacteriovoracaceae bacterium]